MTKQDTENLFALLAIYFPNNPRARDARLISAWHLLLEPYSPADVKAALLDCLRESEFFPDSQAVASRARLAAARRDGEESRKADDAKMLRQLQRLREKMRRENGGVSP